MRRAATAIIATDKLATSTSINDSQLAADRNSRGTKIKHSDLASRAAQALGGRR